MDSYETIGVNFPDMSKYQMNKIGEMALYLAHCDLYPFRSVISNSELISNLSVETYREMAVDAGNKGDIVAEEYLMMSQSLQVGRVDSLTCYSLVLVLVSLLEESFNTLCRLYYNINHFEVELKLYKSRNTGLDQAIEYLEKYAKVSGFKEDKQWEYIKTIREVRNMIVHNGGRLKRDKLSNFQKFEIEYRDEDLQVYLGYQDVVKMYDAVLDYIGRVFKNTPSSDDKIKSEIDKN